MSPTGPPPTGWRETSRAEMDDLPVIQLRPGPTDAELEAERDAKHLQEVARWFFPDWAMSGLTAGSVWP